MTGTPGAGIPPGKGATGEGGISAAAALEVRDLDVPFGRERGLTGLSFRVGAG